MVAEMSCEHGVHECVRYVVEIDGEYWVKFQPKELGRWTKNKHLATTFTRKIAYQYAKDWKHYGAKVRIAR